MPTEERKIIMILYDVRVGNNISDDSWEFITDEFGNNFITKPSIYQRLRIDKTIEGIEPKVVEASWKSNDAARYEFLTDKKLRWANNNKNMNPILLVDENTSDLSICYVTLSDEYILLRYRTSAEILQTFHKKDEYQGAVVVFNTDDLKDSKGAVAQLQLFNKKLKKYEQVNITINTESYELAVNSYVISDKKQIELLKDYEKKLRGRIVGFKIITKPNDLLTSLYITTKELRREVEDLTKDIKNAQIIEISDSFADGKSASEKDIESAKAYLKQRFAEKRIRALTCYGINLPREIVRELRLLYVFKYNTEVKILSCKKSN